MPNPSCIAFEAYRVAMNIDRSWDDLSTEEIKAWWEVVRALADMKKYDFEV
jgi:hypothetical protein